MAYTPIIAPADMVTVLYQEIIDEVTRNDNTIITRAIDAAIAKAKMYLSRYDPAALFGDQTANTAATFHDENLTNIVKDIAAWQVISLGNPNISYEHIRTRYEDAIKELTRIQDGKSDPRWPYLNTTGETAPQGNAIHFNSNTKKSTHF